LWRERPTAGLCAALAGVRRDRTSAGRPPPSAPPVIYLQMVDPHTAATATGALRAAMPSDAGGTLAAVMLADKRTASRFRRVRALGNAVAKRDFGASHPWPLIASSVHEPH
jgi:hypothetical protein